jgi:hypothetical protein
MASLQSINTTGSPDLADDRLVQQVKMAGKDLILASKAAARNSIDRNIQPETSG